MKSAVISPKRVDAALTSGTSPGTRIYFSILHASEYLDCTPSWIEDQLRNGNLPYRWVGNKRVLFKRDLDALMESLPEERGLADVPSFMAKAQSRARVAA